jgi:hypothetical protein
VLKPSNSGDISDEDLLDKLSDAINGDSSSQGVVVGKDYVYGTDRVFDRLTTETSNFEFKVFLNDEIPFFYDPYVILNGEKLSGYIVRETELDIDEGDYFKLFKEGNTLKFRISSRDDFVSNVKKREGNDKVFEIKEEFEVDELKIEYDINTLKKNGQWYNFEYDHGASFDSVQDIEYFDWDFTIKNNMPFTLKNVEVKIEAYYWSDPSGSDYEIITLYEGSYDISSGYSFKPNDKEVINLDKTEFYEFGTTKGSDDFGTEAFRNYEETFYTKKHSRSILPYKSYFGNWEFFVDENNNVLYGSNFKKPGNLIIQLSILSKTNGFYYIKETNNIYE